MIPLKRCDRCGAQAAGYMDIDFHCNRRRCPIRSLLDAKREMAQVAYSGSEDRKSQREALKVMLAVMLWSSEHEDETIGMTDEQMAEYVKTRGPKP